MLKVLEESDKPLNRTQIAEELNDSAPNVSKVVRVLLKHGEIKCIELDRYQSAKLLGWKTPIRRSRFYYVGTKYKVCKK